MPAAWRDEVDAAIAEMERVVRGGPLVIIETLGRGHEEPRCHQALDEYFDHIAACGFTREWVRTDYSFATVEEASAVCGSFFGAEMEKRILAEGWRRVPERTGVWTRATA